MTSRDNHGSTGRVGRLWHAFDGLAGDTMWSAGLDLLSIISGLVSFVLLQQVLDAADYGRFAGLYGLATIFSAVTYSGPGLALVQRFFRFHQDPDDIRASFLSLALIAGVASSLVAVTLARFLIDLSLAEIVVITASELFANSIIWVVSWLVQITAGFPAMIRVRMWPVLLKLVAVPLLYAAGHLTILNLGLTYLVLYSGAAIWLLLWKMPRLGYGSRLRRPSADVWRSSTVFAVPLAASQVQMNGDKVALNAFDMPTDAGLYAAAYRIVHLGSFPVRVIGQAAFHRFLGEGDDQVDGYHLRRATRLTGFIFLVGLGCAGVLYFLLYVLTPVLDLILDYEGAKDIIPWLVLFIPLLAISGTPLNGLLGLGRTRERAQVYLSSAIVSMLLYVTLIPWLGWPGAVAATLVSETYLAVVSWSAMVHYQRVADRRRAEHPVDQPVG